MNFSWQWPRNHRKWPLGKRRHRGEAGVIQHGTTVFEPQPFENPLRRMPLLRRRRLVGF